MEKIRRQVSDVRTWNDSEHYGTDLLATENKGTANLAVLAANGDAIVATSTINMKYADIFRCLEFISAHALSSGVLKVKRFSKSCAHELTLDVCVRGTERMLFFHSVIHSGMEPY